MKSLNSSCDYVFVTYRALNSADKAAIIAIKAAIYFKLYLSRVARKPDFRISDPIPTQTGLYNHIKWLDA